MDPHRPGTGQSARPAPALTRLSPQTHHRILRREKSVMTTVEHVGTRGKPASARTVAVRDRWARAPLVVAYDYGKTLAPSGTADRREQLNLRSRKHDYARARRTPSTDN